MEEIRFGDRAFFGHGCNKNYELALKYYLAAVKKSPNSISHFINWIIYYFLDTLALRSVASMYLNGWGISVDTNEAFKYFMMGADLCDPESMNFIGQLYDQRNGIN